MSWAVCVFAREDFSKDLGLGVGAGVHPVWVWFPQVSIPATVIKSSLAQTGVLEGERGSYEQLYWFYANWDVRSQASLGLGTHWLEKPRNVKRGFSELRVAVPTLS